MTPQIHKFEGPQGSGNSTKANELKEQLEAHGRTVIVLMAETFTLDAYQQIYWSKKYQHIIIDGRQNLV